MKTRRLVFCAAMVSGLCLTGFALSIVPKPTSAGIAGVWSGYVDDERFARLELDTNGTGYLYIVPGRTVANLYQVESWSVSDFTVELRTKSTPTPLDRDADVWKFKYEGGRFIEGEFDMFGIKQTIKLYSEREWQSRSSRAQEYIAQWRKEKRL